ncbi:MAG: site-specific integrase [Burkholderiaceae bacterium]|nr:site-specific integrase [Burkholderiaceae bacterium]
MSTCLPFCWDADPNTAFADFVESPAFAQTSRRRSQDEPAPLSAASIQIYRFMFERFTSWMAERQLTMSMISDADLRVFLSERENGSRRINSDIAHRYVRLIERCYDHVKWPTNPARALLLDAAHGAISLGSDDRMTVLDASQAERFMAALPRVDEGWKRHRDRVMQLVMLRSGLKVAEAIGLMISEIGEQRELDGALSLRLTPVGKQPTSYPHTTRLDAEAARELLAWLAVRQVLPIPGKLVFPANFRGVPLNKSTVYRQVKASFLRAGLTPSRQGGRTLRNTFAVQELDCVTIAELTEHLGLALSRSTRHYAAARQRVKPRV